MLKLKKVKLAKNSSDEECKKLGLELERTVSKAQIKFFPKIRLNYLKFIKDKLWEENIYVTGYNQNITLTGSVFANNKNIKVFEKNINEVMHTFRFKIVSYSWYKEQDDVTYYEINSFSDAEVTDKLYK